jgi:hypothetical protein
MAGEIREVSAPETAAPGQEVSQHRTEPQTTITDADGNTASLEDGSLQMAPQQGSEKAAEAALEVDVSKIPELPVSAAFQEDMQAYRTDVAAIVAAEPSIGAGEAAALFEFAGLAAAAEAATAASDGDWQQGQTVGADIANPDATRQILRSKYGSMADALLAQAVKEAAALPPSVRAWLDRDMGFGRRLGNSVPIVEALALRQFARQTPDAAKRELDQIRASKSYQDGDKLSIAKARILQIVIGRAQPQPSVDAPQSNRGVFPKRAESSRGDDDVHVGPTHQTRDELRRELAALNRLGSDLHSPDGQRRKRAVARRADIIAQLGGPA